jgi:hypothetical protein
MPSHDTVVFARDMSHGVQAEPHVMMDRLLTQPPAQTWKPALQVKPHMPAAQVARASAGGMHAVVQLPQ